jgi:hypothetical protein
MSYSYVKTVFPDFQYSNVYNTKMYENLNINNTPSTVEPFDYKNMSQVSFPSLPPVRQEKVQPEIESKITHPEPNVYNNVFYKPLQKETFANQITPTQLETIKSLLDNPETKALIIKQLNIETERIYNQEIMELISYLLFGLFILLLIDTYSKK